MNCYRTNCKSKAKTKFFVLNKKERDWIEHLDGVGPLLTYDLNQTPFVVVEIEFASVDLGSDVF